MSACLCLEQTRRDHVLAFPTADLQETWQKFRDPDSGHLWFYNSETEDFFFEVTAHEHGWTMYNSAQGPWWFHASEGRFFFDPLMA